MKKICVYTCMTGNYDRLNEIKIIDKNIDFICYTNNKELKSKTWKIIYIDNGSLNNHQLSRKIKMLGTDYINKKYDISVWQDASVIWNMQPSKFVEKYLLNDFSAFIHNERTSVHDEAKEVIRLHKDNKKTVLEHMKFLEKEKFPDNNGLYEMTIFIKRHNNPIVKKTMEIWFETYLNHSKRDQLSFMYAVWKTKLHIDPIKMNVWDNEWVRHSTHNYNETVTDCRIYFGGNIDNQNNTNFLDYKYKINKDIYSISTTIPIDTETLEIEVTDVPCIAFSDVKLNCEYDSFQAFNTIKFGNYNIFYTNKGIIIIKGNFQKNQKLTFSIKLNQLSDFEKYNLVKQLSTDVITAVEDIEILNNRIDELNNKINELNNCIAEQSYLINHPIKNLLKKIKFKILKKQ